MSGISLRRISMNTSSRSLSQRARATWARLSELYQAVDNSPLPSPALLPRVLKELGLVSEVLQIAIAELDRQTACLDQLQTELEAERQRYQELTASMLDGCLLTDIHLIIQEANIAAATLLNTTPQSLIGKRLLSLVYSDDLPLVQSKISSIAQKHPSEFVARLQPRSAAVLNVGLVVQPICKSTGEFLHLRWLLREMTKHNRTAVALVNPSYDPSRDRPILHYSRGDVIPSEPQAIWLVSEGVVKLTTLSERGEEMIVGLVGESMVFGASLTALQPYQAIALSEAKLVTIPISEVMQSPQLAQALLASLKQRLQQTERLLAIYGQIRVEERLYSFLMLLGAAIGQPVERGIRLKARLTHQDFASACCTTRVTVTRLLGKWQEEGKIIQDSHNHLVLIKR
jgi:PAS domain S-box-containing protein